MTDDEIFDKAQKIIKGAGYELAYSDIYVDVVCILAVAPKHSWRPRHTHHCRLLVFKDRVQRYERRFPLNHTAGSLVSHAVHYDTEAQLLSALEQLDKEVTASCWT